MLWPSDSRGMKESLSIVLPVYNEEESIKNVISDIFLHVGNYTDNFEVIVVDDGSVDRTPAVLNEIKKEYADINVVSHDKNRGYGSAIRKGIDLSGKDWIFVMDSDGQFRVTDFAGFWMNKNGYDFILGYRAERRDNLYRIWLADIGRSLGNRLLRAHIKDINCGFKLFRSSFLKNVELISTGGCINFEILFRLLASDVRFTQLPVAHYNRIAGRSTGGSIKVILGILSDSLKVIYAKQKREYPLRQGRS